MANLKVLNGEKFNMLEAGYFISFYHKSGEHDLVSRLLLRFKDGEEPETSEWVTLATSFFSGNYKPDIILRVLKSEEISPSSNTSLDKLGKAIAQKIGSRYEPSALTKIRQTRPLKFLKKHERFEEINGVYRYGGLRVKNILLLDDIITTSTTVNEIKRAIVSSIGDVNLRLFVLGKTFDAWNDGEGDNAEIERFFSKANAEF